MAETSFQDIISKSGHSFSKLVTEYFSINKSNWAIDQSSHYEDYSTNKQNKEMDIVATLIRRVPKGQSNDPYQFTPYFIAVRLFIECKYIGKKNVFWEYPCDEQIIKEDLYMSQRHLSQISPYPERKVFMDHLFPEHHYHQKSIYASHEGEGGNEDAIYKGLNQALHSSIYYNDNKKFAEKGKYIFDYPVLLCNSFDNFSNSNSEIIKDNFIYYRRNYPYNSTQSNYLIDVVSFDNLESFLLKVESELDYIGKQFYNKSQWEQSKK